MLLIKPISSGIRGIRKKVSAAALIRGNEYIDSDWWM